MTAPRTTRSDVPSTFKPRGESMNGERLQTQGRCNVRRSTGGCSGPRISAMALALCVALGGIVVTTLPATALAQTTQSQQQLSIPAGSLRDALDALASQSGITVLYSPELVAGKTTRGLSGRYAPGEALRRLLQGSGLEARDAGDSTFTLRQSSTPRVESQGEARNSSLASSSPESEEVQELERLTVTGTRIRSGDTPSPVITIGSERIQEEGFTDLGEVIRNVPQNFSGGQNPGVIPFNVSGAGTRNTNLTGGSALNLRGLGSDASLTLLNGRRMAYGGISQAIDITAIPVEAVQRIEIVTDGASAIYGSDAVGGVANVILKRDFDGFALGARSGTATNGGLTTREYTAIAGGNWSGGGLLATYKDSSTDPIYARQRSYTNFLHDAWTIYPESDLRSGLISVNQSLGDVAELRLETFRAERSQMYAAHDNLSSVNITATPDATTSLLSPSIEFFLPNDWTLSIAGVRTKDNLDHFQTIEIPAISAIFETHLCYCNEGRVYEVGAEGPLLALPGGDARLAVGAGYRENYFQEYNYLTSAAAIDGSERSRFAYAEINLPLRGPDSSIGIAHGLELTAAARAEEYDSFGRVTTPKLGLIYRPSANYTLSSSWGKSFKAPTLFQLFRTEWVLYDLASTLGGTDFPEDATVLTLAGGNPDLEPERARTWTASLAFHPEAIPGLEAELTWWGIDYTSRVVEPIAFSAQSLSNPANAEFVHYFPTADEQAAIIARDSDGTVDNFVGAPYDPARVVAIIYSHFVNAAEQRIRGVDLSGSYRFDLHGGQLALRGSATWLDSSQRVSIIETDLAGTLFNPPRIAGRIGAVWSRGRISASTFANYKGGVLNVVADEKTSSFTTFDATLRYAIQPRHNILRSRWELALAIQNVLDRSPPLHDTSTVTAFTVPPYDATNYSAIGRFISLSVSKSW